MYTIEVTRSWFVHRQEHYPLVRIYVDENGTLLAFVYFGENACFIYQGDRQRMQKFIGDGDICIAAMRGEDDISLLVRVDDGKTTLLNEALGTSRPTIVWNGRSWSLREPAEYTFEISEDKFLLVATPRQWP